MSMTLKTDTAYAYHGVLIRWLCLCLFSRDDAWGASWILASFGVANGLLPSRHQAISCFQCWLIITECQWLACAVLKVHVHTIIV